MRNPRNFHLILNGVPFAGTRRLPTLRQHSHLDKIKFYSAHSVAYTRSNLARDPRNLESILYIETGTADSAGSFQSLRRPPRAFLIPCSKRSTPMSQKTSEWKLVANRANAEKS